ncbi:DUF192 domain-containing protein [Streptomyces broussonetiae]|uniref:DUF192 domain-containing protein n=1 Tax=Streptomyces broussonetiae TaxID=2686304 RepID=A0A6I6N7R5_9ACTN|nr:DUF192 domain-containing protein [Streptomyces broussonetiae]QHA06541.1 DUF192 domain-containing protein [Streptomyces broussonetiae]
MGRGRWRDGRGRLVVGAGSGEPVTTVPLEIAASYRARTKGLLGRDALDGAMLLTPASGVHTFGMRMPIDVAYLNRRLTVVTVRTMKPGRLGLPRLRARHVLEAAAGTMTEWGLRAGVRVAVEREGGEGAGGDGAA